MDARQRAALVRQNHKRNGGQFSTAQLAAMLNVSERTIRAYLRNEFCVDSAYVAKHGRVDLPLARQMHAAGFTIPMIGRVFGVSSRYIQQILCEREPLCET